MAPSLSVIIPTKNRPETMWRRLTRGQDLLWIFRNRGVLGTARWLRRAGPYYLWLHFTPAGRREWNFDRIHGVDTEGMVPRWKMGDVGPNLLHAVQYLPSKPKKFYSLLDSLPIDFKDFTFIDIGSGKGRTLLLAQRYGFRSIVGVEFVPELCETARKNLETCHCHAEVLCMDATKYEFPDGPLVIYMCNPFDAQLMRQMVRNMERSLAHSPRPVWIVYWNAFQSEAFLESPYFSLVDSKPHEFSIFSTRFLSPDSRPSARTYRECRRPRRATDSQPQRIAGGDGRSRWRKLITVIRRFAAAVDAGCISSVTRHRRGDSLNPVIGVVVQRDEALIRVLEVVPSPPVSLDGGCAYGWNMR
jgi:16S rRNA G966 N2-methylase RsmD